MGDLWPCRKRHCRHPLKTREQMSQDTIEFTTDHSLLVYTTTFGPTHRRVYVCKMSQPPDAACPAIRDTTTGAQSSKEDCGDLLSDGDRRPFRLLRLLDSRNAGDEVHLMRLPDLGPLGDFPAEIERREQRNVDVCVVSNQYPLARRSVKSNERQKTHKQ